MLTILPCATYRHVLRLQLYTIMLKYWFLTIGCFLHPGCVSKPDSFCTQTNNTFPLDSCKCLFFNLIIKWHFAFFIIGTKVLYENTNKNDLGDNKTFFTDGPSFNLRYCCFVCFKQQTGKKRRFLL